MGYNNENERDDYKKRVEKQKKAIENLLEISNQHKRLFSGEMRHALRVRQEECNRLYRKLDKNEFEIAIVGLEKAGKSTFANALMENKILPDADERCTYTSTCIKYGNDRAVVKFFTIQEFDMKLRNKLSAMQFENVEQYSIRTLSLSEYQNLFLKLNAREQQIYENYEHKDIVNILENKESLLDLYLGQSDMIFEGEQLKSDEFKQYIVSKKVAIAVKEVTIESSKLEKIKNAIIYDVPGFDSPTKMHAEQTEERMKKADVIVLIASAEKPSFTAPSLDMFNKVIDEDNLELSEKLFIFGNRADAANTLQKNIDTLKEEAQNYGLLRGEYLESRLLIGSAKAHLQYIGEEDGDFCIKKLEEDSYKKILIHGDGIQYTFEKLKKYNETERFRILKRKVNENNQQIEKIFKQLREEYKGGQSSVTDTIKLMHERDRVCAESKTMLVEGLQKLRSEIREQYNNNSPLSQNLKDAVKELFDSERYGIKEEDIDIAKRELEGTGSSINVEDVEIAIRKHKFNEIYANLSETVLKIAIEDHAKYYNEVIELFETALKINKNASNYEEIKEKISDYVQVHKKNTEDKDCYQTLIERFVRDLVELLIMKPYGMEARMNRFLDDSSAFTGLIMFYNPGDNETDYKRSFLSIAPKDQPLLYALLFHEYGDAIGASKEMFTYLREICKDVSNSTIVMELICSIIKKNPAGAIESLKKEIIKKAFDKYTNEEDILKALIPKLRDVKSKMHSDLVDMEKYDFTDEKKFVSQYKKHFGNMEKREYTDIVKDYDVDLKILKDFLVSASISAICIEKPFVAKEVKAIEGLIDCIESGSYDYFITDNLKLLLKDSLDEFVQKQEEVAVNKAVVREIEDVLKNMAEE